MRLNNASFFLPFVYTMKANALSKEFRDLERTITSCSRCPRLVRWREDVALEKVARFRNEQYWGKPVPPFGDPDARLLIVGLAPAAHGANRTGRMFTGDRSGEWLYRTLHKFGFANRPASISRTDGLKLTDSYITAAARCAPPQNKLLPKELQNCRPFLLTELRLLKNVCVIVGLGKVACDVVYDAMREMEMTSLTKRPPFGHGLECTLNEQQTLIASFHPSQQNTFTGKLTQPMFDAVFQRAKEIIKIKKSKVKK